MRIKNAVFIIILSLICQFTSGQIDTPIKWNFSLNNNELIFTASIEKGWHLYDLNLPEGGPVSTSFNFDMTEGCKLIGTATSNSKVTTKYDEMFGLELRWFDNMAKFIQKVEITNPEKFHIKGEVNYMACNDIKCLPPTSESFEFTKKNLPNTLVSNENINQKTTESITTTIPVSNIDTIALSTDTQKINAEWWKPVINELNNFGTIESSSGTNWWLIFLSGFIGGLIALITPCVWPLIPLTVSFFLKKAEYRKDAIKNALLYSLSIVVIYLLLGICITLIFGASALNELSTSAFFNLLFFALLVLFAISFLGAFDLRLPSSWINKLDKKSTSTSSLLSLFFMAFTLVLVSFSCTGPIIGTLLVEAASLGNTTGPAIGMFGFALALGIPFGLFAIFPTLLHNLPKSGGWLNSVKVVLGFLELAFALKFLSVADLAYGWGILDREVFLVLWVIIFILLGIYLLGKIKFANDSELPYISVSRLFLAMISLSFALYMVPGLWGAPLKAISAFSPPLYTQDFNLYDKEIKPQFYNYEEGMEYAKKYKKPVMIDFTGYGCVNCREMEASVLTNPTIKQIIDNDFVLISLYVDDKTPLSEPFEIEEFGKIRKIKTIGDKWSYLQRSKFGANAQPFYVLLNNQGIPIAPAYAYDKDVDKFRSFLDKGLKRKN